MDEESCAVFPGIVPVSAKLMLLQLSGEVRLLPILPDGGSPKSQLDELRAEAKLPRLTFCRLVVIPPLGANNEDSEA